MKIKDLVSRIGLNPSYEIHWYNEQQEEVMAYSDFSEAILELF